MKLKYFAAVAGGALALASFAHAASAGQSTVLDGYVDADYSYMNVHVSGYGSGGVNVWGGKAAIAFPVNGNWGGQVDAVVNDFQAPNSIGGGSQTIGSPTAHGFYRTDKWLAGAYVGAEIAPHISLIGGGLEGQYRACDRFTVDGSFGYAGLDRHTDAHLWGVRVGGRGFVTDNITVNGSINYANLDGGGYSADMWTEKLGGEYKFDKAPVSLTLAYERADVNKFHLSSDSVLVGVRWTFNGSLRDRDNKGASLSNITDTFGGNAGQTVLSAVSGYLF